MQGSVNKKSIQQSFVYLIKLFLENRNYILYKYLPTSLMFLLSAYIYSLLRGVKDSILVPDLGAELISFVKLYGVFPSTIIFFICFSKLANILSRDRLYYCIVSFFISFFLLYAFILNIDLEFFQPDLSELITTYPNLKYQLIMIQHWPATLFYIMSELSGTVILTLLFWQLANDIYSVKEAKKTYASFGLIGQLGLVLAGVVQNSISSYFVDNSFNQESWIITIKWMMLSIFAAGLGLMFLYHWMHKNILSNPELCDREHNSKKEKISLSVIESFKYVFSSRYLWLIMLIVFCYGVGINMIEIVWKAQLKIAFPSQNAFSAFMGKFHIYFGFSTIMVMFLGTYILRTFKWIVSALFTPLGAGLSGIIFFNLIILKDLFEPLLTSFDISILSMSIAIGSLQVILFKSFNYAFVDSTKEMAFIPLDRELRTKGKAAVDVVGGRFGKTFGSILQQIMFQFITPNVANLTKEIFIIFLLTMLLWVFAVIQLNKEFHKLTHN